MKKTNFTPKIKTAYHQLIQNGEYIAARWLLHMLNTKRYIESLPMHLLNDSAWTCAYYVDRDNNGYSFRIR